MTPSAQQFMTVKNKETTTLYCSGCEKHCRYGYKPEKECEGIEYYIWPGSNIYLMAGLAMRIQDVTNRLIIQPVVLIDFNHYNARFFLSENWLSRFEGMRLILVADRMMTAIAHYWYYHDNRTSLISAVLFHDDSTELITEKIRNTFMGKTSRPSADKPRLSENEYYLLDAIYHGNIPKKIASSMNTSVKNIYTMKLRVEKKLGVTVSGFFM